MQKVLLHWIVTGDGTMTNFINWDAISAKALESTKIPSQQLPSLHVFLMQYRRKLLFKQHYLWWFGKHDVTLSIAAVCYVNGKTYEIKIGFCIESRSEKKNWIYSLDVYENSLNDTQLCRRWWHHDDDDGKEESQIWFWCNI